MEGEGGLGLGEGMEEHLQEEGGGILLSLCRGGWGRWGAWKSKRPIEGTTVGHLCLHVMVTSKSRVPSLLWHVLWFLHSYWLHSSLTIQLGLENHSHNLLKSPELHGPPGKQKPGRMIHELTSRAQFSPKDGSGDQHLVRRVGVTGWLQPLT